MGRQPRSGDIPWLSAHSILNWIGGDTFNANPLYGEVKGLLQISAIGLPDLGLTSEIPPVWKRFLQP
jgi:hypothetical protein